MYEALVSPVLTYGSDVWGHLKVCRDAADSLFFFKYMKSILKVKSSPSHVAVLGESGQLPTSVLCHINVLCFYNRLQNLDSKCIVRVIFDEPQTFHEMGFNNWITKVNGLVLKLNINLHCTDTNLFKMYCKTIVKNDYTRRWTENLCDVDRYLYLKMYRTIQHNFGREPYIDLVSDARYRVAITKIRNSSHPLEIERGRHTNPKTPVHLRLCQIFKEVEDEMHFLISCKKNEAEIIILFDRIREREEGFSDLSPWGKFNFIHTSSDSYILKWLEKFIYKSLENRNI